MFKKRDCFFVAFLKIQAECQSQGRIPIVRIQLQGNAKLIFRFLIFLLVQQDLAQGAMEVGDLRLRGNCQAIVFFRLGQVLHKGVDIAEFTCEAGQVRLAR